jgi:hypothetical protein
MTRKFITAIDPLVKRRVSFVVNDDGIATSLVTGFQFDYYKELRQVREPCDRVKHNDRFSEIADKIERTIVGGRARRNKLNGWK